MTHRFLALTLVLLLLPWLVAAATAAGEAKGVTTSDPNIPLENLRLLLKPLRKAELVTETEAWLDLLEEKVAAISRAEIAAKKGKTGADLGKLRAERDALIARATAATAALKDKGGDIAEYETYVEAVSGAPMEGLDVKNPSKIVATVLSWLKSPEGGLLWLKNIVSFLVILVAFRIFANVLGKIVRKAVSRWKNASELLKDFFANTVRKVTFFIGLIVALSVLGIDVGPFVAAIGAVGFIIAFALQGTLSNFASGIMILLYRPYDIGEVVTVAGITGKVHAMSLVSTTVKTPDNQTVVVPNSSIWGNVITNVTGTSTRRVDLVFGIGYSDDIAKAQSILTKILADHPKVLDDPAPVIKVHELADSSVNFVVRPWARTADYWDVYWDVTRAVKERFDEEGVSIPFPQHDVHLIQETPTA